MLSLLLSVILIIFKTNNLKITTELFNFAIVCLVYDIFYVFYNTTYIYGINIDSSISFTIYLISVIEAILVIRNGVGNYISEESYTLAIIIVVLETFALILKKLNNKSKSNNKLNNKSKTLQIKTFENKLRGIHNKIGI